MKEKYLIRYADLQQNGFIKIQSNKIVFMENVLTINTALNAAKNATRFNSKFLTICLIKILNFIYLFMGTGYRKFELKTDAWYYR